jgi:hypothetical protein
MTGVARSLPDASAAAGATAHGPWNPGVLSEPPLVLQPLATLFRPENVFTGFDQAHELADVTGLPVEALVVFRPERLVVHEILVRVTADFSVPDGPRLEDLGINFRALVTAILARHVAPRMDEIVASYGAMERSVAVTVDTALSEALGAPASDPPRRRWLGALVGRKPPAARPEDPWAREERAVRDWTARARGSGDPTAAAYRALARLATAVRGRHGRLWGDRNLLAPVATGLACNDYGATLVGRLLDPLLRQAAQDEGYRWLPAQPQPVVMNTKGASASGKSTMRPLQRRLAAELGLNWSDFAFVTPDIWRKFLLDYDALGAAFRYAGAFTSHELAIVDQKLDRYMAGKAGRGNMSHLLIDRFRFDSFAPHSDEAGSNLLTRFGRAVYLFFMITPPHETVERSWRRGLEVGRYKAVDDLLAHNVEAYSGMPELFFTWALSADKSVHYEFLDNSVAYGERPRTVAFGWNGEMNVLDVKCLLDIDRYRRIDIEAKRPAEVYPGPEALTPQNNARFLAECVRRMPAMNFAERASGRVYARFESARLAWTDPEALLEAFGDTETRAGLLAIAPDLLAGAHQTRPCEALDAGRFHTLGQWGGG